MLQVKIINESKHELPAYQTPGSAGMDIRANLSEPVRILPMRSAIIPTGLFTELPVGFEAQIRSRSGLAFKNQVIVLNAPGTIDSDYRDEIKVILYNLSYETLEVKDGDRIAQMVVAKHEIVKWEAAAELAESERDGGFGSTGIN